MFKKLKDVIGYTLLWELKGEKNKFFMGLKHHQALGQVSLMLKHHLDSETGPSPT